MIPSDLSALFLFQNAMYCVIWLSLKVTVCCLRLWAFIWQPFHSLSRLACFQTLLIPFVARWALEGWKRYIPSTSDSHNQLLSNCSVILCRYCQINIIHRTRSHYLKQPSCLPFSDLSAARKYTLVCVAVLTNAPFIQGC